MIDEELEQKTDDIIKMWHNKTIRCHAAMKMLYDCWNDAPSVEINADHPVSSRAEEYMGQIDCDVYNGDTDLKDLKALVMLLIEYIVKKKGG